MCYLFIKMAQDNTCSYTIGMNSYHIFMPIRIHLWLVDNTRYAHPQLALLQIAKMYTCGHDI